MRDLKVAAVSMHSEVGEIERNLDRTESFASEASRRGVHIICFPELSLTGYTLDDPAGVYTHLGPYEVIERVAWMARKEGLVIIAGIIELNNGERPFVSQVVVGPEGVLGTYRKTHLSPKEKERYRAGDEIPVFSHGGVVFGVQLCYEAHFPEISTLMALKGAHVVFMPHASPRGNPREKTESWLRHMPSRAFDNALYVVACNQVGSTKAGFTFPGVVLVLGPSGILRAKYEGTREEMILVDLRGDEMDEIRRHKLKYFIPHRRPELYVELGRQTRPGNETDA